MFAILAGIRLAEALFAQLPPGEAFVPAALPAAADAYVRDAFELRPELLERYPLQRYPIHVRKLFTDITAFYEEIELDELREEILVADFGTGDSTKIAEVNLDDVDRVRAGVQGRFGIESIMFELAVYGERFEPLDEFELIGTRMGITGVPRLAGTDEVAFLLDYGVNITVAAGNGDVQFTDSTTGGTFDVDGDIGYLGEQAWLGAGIEVFGVQLSAGAIADLMQGRIDVDVDDDIEFDSSNVGAYARLAYRAAHFPLFASARLYMGEYRGFSAELGVRF